VANIATKPPQAQPILDWCRQIATERIIPFASVYPFSPTVTEEVEAVAQAGIRGIKIHPCTNNSKRTIPRYFPFMKPPERRACRSGPCRLRYRLRLLDNASPTRFARRSIPSRGETRVGAPGG
jgi:hypothetical protein